MATDRIRYVNRSSAGGNGTTRDLSGANAAYATLTAAEAAEAGDISTGTGSDEVVRFLCVGGAEGNATTSMTFSTSWVCDATGYVSVEADIDHPTTPQMHPGSFDDTLYHLRYAGSAGGVQWPNGNGKIVFTNIQFGSGTSSTANRKRVGLQGSASFANGPLFVNCIFDGVGFTGAGSTAIVGTSVASYARFRNCKFTNWDNTDQSSNETIYPGVLSAQFLIYACTFVDCNVAIGNGNASSSIVVKNCLFQGCGADSDGGAQITGSNNASTNATSVGTSPRVNQTFTFADTAHRLAAGDLGALGYGVDLSGDSNNPVSDDWEGDARDASTPDIGWDEYVAVVVDQFTEHLIRVYV